MFSFEGILSGAYFLFLRYGGLIALCILIFSLINYFKDKKAGKLENKKDKYIITIIICICFILINVVLWILTLQTINQFVNILQNNVSNLII